MLSFFSGRMEVGLAQFLQLAWIAGTLPIVVAFIPISKLNWFREALMGFAKRGKTMQYSSQKFTVPQRFFLHFYVVGSVWTMLLLVTTGMYAYRLVPLETESFAFSTITSYLIGSSSIRTDSTKIVHRNEVFRAVLLLLLVEVHILRRLYETIYVFNYSPLARMHIFGYLTGLFFYVAAPLSLCSNCALEVYEFTARRVAEYIVKSKSQIPVTEFESWHILNPLLKLGWQQWIGAAVFFWGWIHQQQCHAILGSLREHSKQINDYIMPHGDWFEVVSCPHYLSEIVIYTGLVIASGGTNLTIWLLLVFVVANLTFAAVETHRWYLQKFEGYPSTRFAIIPFLL
ncbi:hypothetical protein L6164_005619 [Bauhinia variegata]|uniref:Uncharacterized protein n=1 Tax=Bauhinia variegata TaxID=167791 RepID=A0ACB9PTZ4_BAUVA|nr:hypothetical protein L6164_005619 [Bauhinia variegata]